jgi:signal transduction histidine kinase
LDNAVKYTESGSIEIVIYNNIENNINIDVRDTGIGISEEYLDQIFNPYSQEEVGYTRAYEGVGLGLSLVKKFLSLLGADISVRSKKGVGTTFTITFKM